MAISSAPKNRLTISLLIALVSLCVGIGIGVAFSLFVNGERTGVSEGQEELRDDKQEEKKQATTSPVEPASSIPVERLSDLADVSKFESRLLRYTALQDMLADKDVAALQTYYEDSKEIQQPNLREETQYAIVNRIAVVDPRTALDLADEFPTRRRGSLIDTIFREWSLSNLDEAVAHASNLDDAHKVNAIQGVLWSREDLSESRLREIARQVGNETVAIDFIALSQIKDSIDNPARAWNTFISNNRANIDDLSNGQIELLGSLAHSWIKEDGIEVVSSIAESISHSDTLESVMLRLVNALGKEDPAMALTVAMQMPQGHFSQHTVLRTIESWAKSDPGEALDAAIAVEARALSRQLQDRVLLAWAQSDAYDLMGNVGSLPPNIREIGRQQALIAIAQESPQEAIGLMSELTTRKSKNSVAEAIAINWAKQDFSSAVAWIKTDQDASRIQDQLLNAVFRELASDNPEYAFEKALEQPVDGSEVGLEAEVINWVAFWDVDAATSMLPNVRNDETKAEAYSSLVRSLSMAGDSEGALDLALQYAETGEFKVGFQSIFWMIAWRDPEVLFNRFDQLPSNDLKLHVADLLIDQNDRSKGLSEQQVGHLNDFRNQVTDPDETPSDREMREMLKDLLDTLEEDDEEEEDQ